MFDFTIPERALPGGFDQGHRKRFTPELSTGPFPFSFAIPDHLLPFHCECEPPCKGTLVGDRMQHDYDCEYWTLPVGVNKTPFDW